jgi:Tol biopolymer transport system component
MPPGHYEALSISHDGIHAAIVKSSSPSESSIWLVDLVRGGASPLSSGQGRNDAPIWSPDGARLVWAADRSGPQNVFVKDVNDAAPERQLYASDVLFKNPVDWSRDGRWIVLSQLDQGTSQNIWLLDASGTKPPTIVIRGPAQDLGGLISPDQRWIAYTADDSGRLELYVQSFPTAGRKVQISDQGAVASWWTPDTRQLIFLGDDLRSLWRVDVQSGPALSAGSPRKFATLPADIIAVDATPDRQRFLALAPERSGSGSLTVVQNWRSALAAKR